MQALALLASLGYFVCLIIVLIKLFQQKGVLHGILGILCFLYPFIWGWIESGKLGIKNVMIVWTICMVVSAVLGGSLAPHH